MSNRSPYSNRWSRALLVAGASAGIACSWTRFDDVQKDAPVLLLNKPDNVGFGFGSSLASSESGSFYRVFVGAAPGQNGGAEFELGSNQGASKDAARSGHCGAGCTLARRAAPLQRAVLDGLDRTLCAAEGIGTAGNQKPLGIQVQCEGGDAAFLAVLALPSGVSVPEPGKQLTLASEDGDYPIVMAGAMGLDQAAGSAWFYPSKSQNGSVLDPGVSVGSSFGGQVAVLGAGGGRLLVVSEPEAGRLFFFDEAGAPKGCVSSSAPRFGKSLAVGKVNSDVDEELLVASDQGVHVLSGAALAPAIPATCGALPSAGELVKLACRATADLDGCGGADFGAAIAVADFDRDGDGEVLVGAPGMSVRDESDAGAVFVFDVEGDHLDWMAESRFISSAESGDRLGTALAVVHQPGKDVFVAGAPGNGKAALFFCSKLLPAGKRGVRCE